MIFRIDDVSANTDLKHLNEILDVLAPVASVMLAVSPLVHDVSAERPGDRERAFPRRLSAMSDHRNLFKVEKMGMPLFGRRDNIQIASHGLVHVDHRLMGYEAQELSIVTSCSLLQTKTFVPPFNKWNLDTEAVCREHDVKLIKFEDGWQHVKFNDFNPAYDRYYLHTHDTSAEWLRGWLK